MKRIPVLLTIALGGATLSSQELAPRAYVITPVRSNAVTLSYSYFDGDLQFEGALPITDATGRLHVPLATFYHALDFFGRSANLAAGIGYGDGHFEGKVGGSDTSAHRTGLTDAVIRFSVNLVGGPAMTLDQMRQWRQKTLVGASLKLVAPTGQNDPTKLVNLGNNRWAFKPEIALSRRWGNWILDAYGAVWFYTKNPEFYPGQNVQTQEPIEALEAHLSYDVRPRFWASLDANFWYGGRTSVNGAQNPATLQRSSRVGITTSFPLTKSQALKLAYARGAVIKFGGDFQVVTVAWQYSWIGGSGR